MPHETELNYSTRELFKYSETPKWTKEEAAGYFQHLQAAKLGNIATRAFFSSFFA